MRSRHSAVEVGLLLAAAVLLAVTLVTVLGPTVARSLTIQFPDTEETVR